MKSTRKKALIIVDVQPSFLNDRNSYIVENILKLLSDSSYDAYVEATFHAEKGSLWEIQQNWICPEGDTTRTILVLSEALKKLKPLQVHKETKSVFKSDEDVVQFLDNNEIKEVHIVGLDTNDCVLATAYEAFDLGFVTRVIESCCQSSSSDKLHKYALEMLRGQNMTDSTAL